MDFRKWRLLPCLASLVVLGGASSAHAAQELYPTNAGARTLDAGLAGYTASTSSEGLCVQLLLCPAIVNEYRQTGGVQNTGYLSTRLGSLLGVGATSEGVFQSPTFTYDGVEGKPAETVRVALARRSDVAALLQVAGNDATYSVDVVQVNGGGSVSAISGESLAGLSTFSEKAVEIDPGALKIGSQYRIRITSRFTSGVQVVPGGSADYDNIRIEAEAADIGGNGGGGNGGGGNGGGGNSGGGGNGGGTGSAGGAFAGNGVTGTAELKGTKLVVKAKCKRSVSKSCKLALQAKLAKKGPSVSKKAKKTLKPGKKAKVALKIKPKYLPRLTELAANHGKVVLRQKVKAGGKPIKGFVKVKLA